MRINKELEKIWTERIEDFKKSGMTQIDWCKTNNLTYNQLKYWLYKRRLGASPSKVTKKESKWIPVDVSKDTDLEDTNGAKRKDKSLTLKFRDISIDIYPGYNRELLSDVLSLLKSIC